MIAIGSDHGGFELKGHIIEHLKEKGIEVKDFGTYSEASVDYPDCAKPVCKAVLDGECECGILICGRELANMIVDTYLEAEFQGGRHADRIKKIHEIETM